MTRISNIPISFALLDGRYVNVTGDTMTGALTVPTIIGGTGTTSDLTLQTTSGVGATGADMHFLVGNNGATEAMTILNNGNVGIGTTGPGSLLQLGAGSLTWVTDNTQDIGASGATRPRTGYFGTSISTPNIVNPAGTDLTITPAIGAVVYANFPAGNGKFIINGPANSTQVATGLLDVNWTWNDAPSAFTLIKGSVTNTNSAAGSLLLDLQVGSVSKFNIRKDGQGYFAGNVGIGTTGPTAYLAIKAGTATASTAPLKFTSGTLNTTAEAGAMEFLTDDLYLTITTGAARKAFILDDGARLTSGKIPIATTNGRLIDGQTPLTGTKVYYVADTSGGAVTRKLTFIDGILVSET